MVYCSAAAGHSAAKQPRGQVLWYHRFPYIGHHHHYLCHMEESCTKLSHLQGCLWAEVISPLNRKESYKVGVCGEGSQNTINWYSPLSNYAAALPGMCTNGCGTSSASWLEQTMDLFVCPPRGMDRWVIWDFFSSFQLVWMRIKHKDIVKGFCHAGQVHASTVGMEGPSSCSVFEGLKFMHFPPTTSAFLGSQGDGLRIILYGASLRCYQP